MQMNDALRLEKRISYICNHHEQASSIAAEGYARTTGKLAVVSVTSGPGGTNTITGVIGQWLDSAPVLYLSGQVKYETTIASAPNLGLRQLGDQEINIVDMVKPVTKYAKMITDPTTIKAELDKAIFIATSGRQGPVWLDIPLNVQGALIDEKALQGLPLSSDDAEISCDTINDVIACLTQAKRPLLIAGHGIRLAKAQTGFQNLARQLAIPVVTTFNGFDLLETSSDHFIGRIGTLGSRAGNFALQNADLILCLGTRNNIRQISYNWPSFAHRAKKILVDIDPAELHKPTLKGDLLIQADAGRFINKLITRLPSDYRVDGRWLEWCQLRKNKYPVVLDAYKQPNREAVHPYHFVEALTSRLNEGAQVVAGNGSACVVLFQAGIVKAGQRMFWNSGCAAMGYDLPAAIGAAVASGRDVICLTGDGSIQMNLQELQTIKHYRLPIKIFLLNNQGYRSIEQTQAAFFGTDYIGCNQTSGVSFPDNAKLAELYGLNYFRLAATNTMTEIIDCVLASPNATLCEVVLENGYNFAPKLSSEKLPDGRLVSKPLEDLYPFLDRDELAENMIHDDVS
jgi:acetolactate synthase-1/2/3 large subunit